MKESKPQNSSEEPNQTYTSVKANQTTNSSEVPIKSYTSVKANQANRDFREVHKIHQKYQ